MTPTVSADALDGVSATTLWTLRNRAEEALHPRSSFKDEWAVRLYRQIDGDYARFGRLAQVHALRATALDDAIRDYLAGHPRATVVALGEGLQTTYWRLGRPDVDWVSVDLAPVMDLRERLLPAEPRIRSVRGSALDDDWAGGIDSDAGVFVSAEGLLMYFEPDQALSLIAACAARFPGGRMFFDSIPAWFSRRTLRGLRLAPGYTAPRMPWSLTVSDAARLPDRVPGVRSAAEVAMPYGRGLYGRRTVHRLSHSRPLRDHRPAMTVLDFAAATNEIEW